MKQFTTIKWSESVWFFDVDDTLCDTSDISTEATRGIAQVFRPKFGNEVAKLVQDKVNEYYALILAGARVGENGDWSAVPGGKKAFDSLMASVREKQKEVILKYGNVKRWSREVFVKIAADDIGIEVTPELVHEAVDRYWWEITQRMQVFPDALKLIGVIRSYNRPIYLLTSSDARLKMLANGQFVYDPSYSEGLKRERIESLRDKGMEFNVLSIGDPEDKPHLDFFQKCVKKAEEDLGKAINLNQAIMVGDSYGSDLQTPKEQMGFGLVILIDRTSSGTEIEDLHQINTDDLSQIVRFI